MSKTPSNEPPAKRVVLMEGTSHCVVFAQLQSGRCHARDYLFGLPPRDQRKFGALFSRLCAGGKLSNPDRLRDLDKVKVDLIVEGRKKSVTITLWEIKIDGHRMLAFQDRADWVLTNGSPKVNKKAFRGEIDTARGLMQDYLSR